LYFTSIMALATNARAPLTVRWGLCVRRCGGVGCGYAIGTPDCARRAPPIARVRRNTPGRVAPRGAWRVGLCAREGHLREAGRPPDCVWTPDCARRAPPIAPVAETPLGACRVARAPLLGRVAR